jgi:hypothetical protein
MKRVPVVSLIVAEVGYDPVHRRLEILFRSGAIRLYYFVPEEIYGALMDADSAGTYFNRHIKNVYENHRIAEPRIGPPRSGRTKRGR